MLRTFVIVGLLSVCAGVTAERSWAGGMRCPVTVPPERPSAGEDFGPGGFSYGNARLRASLYWPRGTLRAGTLPDGGSMASIEDDGSIRAKVGWWRKRGKLLITGRRLDRFAPRLRADVSLGYANTGFQPTALLFPTVGCWRVTGKAGGARLTFVVQVTKLQHSVVHFGRLTIAVPSQWVFRLMPGPSSQIAQVSNASFRLPGGGDPFKEGKTGTFVLTLVPLGTSGHPATPKIRRSDFLAPDAPARPVARAVANHSYCTPSGPCVAISLVYRGSRVPAPTLAAVNRMLASLRATRAP